MADFRYQILIDEQPDAELTSDLSEIEVTESVRGETTFRIRFAIDLGDTDFALLNDQRLIPGVDRKLTVVASVDSVSSCLVHGVITDRKSDLKHGGDGSSLVVSGKDRRILMGRNGDQRGPLNGTVSLIVLPILTRYNFIPDIEQGDSTIYSDLTNSLNQAHSDLELVNRLAAEQGYEFWVDAEVGPGGTVVETAHFRSSPPRNQGVTSSLQLIAPSDPKVLSMNTGTDRFSMLSFSSSRISEIPNKSGALSRINPDSGELERARVDGPSLDPLGTQAPSPDNSRPIISAGDAQVAQRRQDAALIDASWVIRAKVETSVHALGTLVRPHDIITVQGTGSVDDGSYFVWSVTHHIDAADHRMHLELRRNAVGAT
ncbi:MAG TPA: hypothetical protein VIF57_25695 [Polyangia bacterium]|jgi:hypothetical protein